MSDLFWSYGLIAIFFIGIFVNYGAYAVTVCRWSQRPEFGKNNKSISVPKLEIKDTVMCYIPLLQVCKVKEAMYGSATIEKVLSIISAVGITLNLINKFFLPINGYVMFACNIIMFICTAMFMLIYNITTARCCYSYGFGMLMIVLNFIAPCWFCTYQKFNIPEKVKNIYKEDRFNEHASETVIKQRHS